MTQTQMAERLGICQTLVSYHIRKPAKDFVVNENIGDRKIIVGDQDKCALR